METRIHMPSYWNVFFKNLNFVLNVPVFKFIYCLDQDLMD